MRALVPLTVILLAGCGEAVEDDHFAEDIKAEREASAPVFNQSMPVRIGELGPSFPACGAAGTTRNVPAGASLEVRAAPFDTAAQTGAVPSGTRFFVCTRSHDQKWFGIVYAEESAGQVCGVSGPATARRDYAGPCRSGWIPSAFVRLTADVGQAQ